MEGFEQERGMIWMVAAALKAGVVVQVDVLEAERGEEDEGCEKLAGSACGEPAVDPGAHHAGEKYVCKGEGCEEECRPGEQRGFCNADADVCGDEGEGADDV